MICPQSSFPLLGSKNVILSFVLAEALGASILMSVSIEGVANNWNSYYWVKNGTGFGPSTKNGSSHTQLWFCHLSTEKISSARRLQTKQTLISWLGIYFFNFYFILEYSQLTMLWQFQVRSRATQPHICTYPSTYMHVSILPQTPFPSRLGLVFKVSQIWPSVIFQHYFLSSSTWAP